MTTIKICGLTRGEDATFAAECGAAYVGVILAGGPRHVSIAQAGHVFRVLRHGVRRVAVFDAQAESDIIAISQSLALDVIQLHSTTAVDTVTRLMAATGCTVWPVLRIDGSTLPPDAASLAIAAGWLVLDAKVEGQLGGTGVALDWSGLVAALATLRRDVPTVRIVLAGGLRQENVAEAIRLLAPDVVDVSSGVEIKPGVKNPDAVQQFVSAAHAAMESR